MTTELFSLLRKPVVRASARAPWVIGTASRFARILVLRARLMRFQPKWVCFPRRAVVICVLAMKAAGASAVEYSLPYWNANSTGGHNLGDYPTCEAAYSVAAAFSEASCIAFGGQGCTPAPSLCSSIQLASAQYNSQYLHISPGYDTGIFLRCPPGALGSSNDGAGLKVCLIPDDRPTLKAAGPADGPGRICCLNPIDPALGNKFLVQTDYAGSGPFPLVFTRTYSSGGNNGGGSGDLLKMPSGTLGRSWTASYLQKVVLVLPTSTNAAVHRPDGKIYSFSKSDGIWSSGPDITDRLEELAGGWKYTTSEGDLIENYDSSGKLTSIANRAGLVQTLTYFTSGPDTGLLQTVTDPFGRTLTFSYSSHDEYGSSKRIGTMTDPAGNVTTYGYGDVGQEIALLASVTFPDDTPGNPADNPKRTYHYNEQALSELDYALTGITDENNSRFATYGYDSSGRASSSTHAGGAGQGSVVYGSSIGSATVTDALGAQRTYGFTVIKHVNRNVSIIGDGCPTCGPAVTQYQSEGFIGARTDWNTNKTCYVHDVRGLETERVEGLASGANCASLPPLSGVQRKISTEWHPTFRLMKRLAEPMRLTTYVFNGEGVNCGPGGAPTPAGLVCTKSVQATTDTNGSLGFSATVTGTARTWTYTHNAEGQVLTENGPRTDVADVTTYAYHANAATCTATLPGASTTGCRGQVNTIGNALSHVTTIDEYNAHGQPLKVTDPNGLVSTLEYDVRQRMTKRIMGAGSATPETTLYEYWPTGLLKKVTNPDASFVQYTYDDAHRLTQLDDSLGNKIVYTLDLMGNRTKEDIKDPLNTIFQTMSREYNNLNRLIKVIGGTNPLTQVTQYGYDNQGNVTTVDGPLAGTVDLTTNAYDELNRLFRITSPVTIGGSPTNAVTEFTFDGIDQVTKVKDPRLLETNITVSGLGDRTLLASPDTGNTNSTYDAAGNLLTQTDAKGQLTSYTYDALNRLSTITYQGGVVHTYQYDQGAFGKGKLTKIIEPNSTTDYVFDIKGRLTGETRTINAIAHVTSYGYDSVGRMNSMIYPGGRELTYTLDSLGRVQQITTTKSGNMQTVVSSVTYRPFGPTNQFSYGNGQTYTRGFDLDGRIASYTLGTMSVGVNYDDASRIFKLAASGQSDRNFTYDELDRLTGFTFGAASQNFGYDVVGNRTSKVVGAATDTYTSSPTSNRLATITGANPRTYGYDNNGSVTGDSINTFGYDTRGRMTSATSAIGASTYLINSVGQRIRKTNVQGDTVYHHDAQGRLIAETSPTGTIQKEYIYLGNTPVAVIQ